MFVSLAEFREHILSVLTNRIRNGDFTERQLATRTGISQPHVHHILCGKRLGSDSVMDLLARAGHVYPPGDERNNCDPDGWWRHSTPPKKRAASTQMRERAASAG